MVQAINESPFVAENIVVMDGAGREQLILTVKATFSLPESGGNLVSLAEQRPIEYVDIFEGESGESSVIYEADLGMVKPSTDVVLVGHAQNNDVRKGFVDVGLRVGTITKVARVYGNRVWQSSMTSTHISRPGSFDRIPLVYERAYGGVDNSHPDTRYHEFNDWNPVGTGYIAKKSKKSIDGMALPNIEDPTQPIRKPDDRPPPCGFGFISGHWKPRVNYRGTYDDSWLKNQMPLLPQDFDSRYYCGASSGLTTSSYLVGGEEVIVQGVTEGGRKSFKIPKPELLASICIGATVSPVPVLLNTVVIDADAEELVLVWRGACNIHKVAERVRWSNVRINSPIEYIAA